MSHSSPAFETAFDFLAGQANARGLPDAIISAPAPAPVNVTAPIADLLFTLSAAKVILRSLANYVNSTFREASGLLQGLPLY